MKIVESTSKIKTAVDILRCKRARTKGFLRILAARKLERDPTNRRSREWWGAPPPRPSASSSFSPECGKSTSYGNACNAVDWMNVRGEKDKRKHFPWHCNNGAFTTSSISSFNYGFEFLTPASLSLPHRNNFIMYAAGGAWSEHMAKQKPTFKILQAALIAREKKARI